MRMLFGSTAGPTRSKIDAVADEVATNHDVGDMEAEPHLHRLVVTAIAPASPLRISTAQRTALIAPGKSASVASLAVLKIRSSSIAPFTPADRLP
jgi:hypothetical protein